jgi:hypothetical protein
LDNNSIFYLITKFSLLRTFFLKGYDLSNLTLFSFTFKYDFD